MDDPLGALEKASEQYEKIKAILTSGRWSERVLGAKGVASLLMLAIGVAVGIGTSWWYALLLLVPGFCLILLVAYRLMRSSKVDLSKLKGASPFWEDEGDLFEGLGQDIVLSEIRGKIISGSTSVVLVHGPIGSGKTSLVNAGLRDKLTSRHFIYVNAGEANFQESLIKQVGALWVKDQKPGTAPMTMDEIITSEDIGEQVIIIDDADLVRDRSQLMKWVSLALALGRIPPFRTVLVLVLEDEEYFKNWLVKDWSSPNAPMPVHVERIARKDALERAASMCAKAQLMASEALLGDIVAGITMEPGSNVSPLSLSVVIQSIGVNGWRPFGISDYRSSGYAAGVMAAYIHKHFVARRQTGREVLSALVRHVNKGSQFVDVSDLDLPQMSDGEILKVLREVSFPEVRILRATQSPSQFFILDDWLPALKVAPNSEVTFLEDYVGKKYIWWLQWLREKRAGIPVIQALGERRYLLSGYELRKLVEGKSALGNDPGLLAYLDRSRAYRNGRSLLYGLLGAACVLGLAFAYFGVKKDQAQKLERGWGLPNDFARYGKQISELSVVCMVDDLTFIPRNLTYLEANCRRITSLQGLPPNLHHLGISDTQVGDIAGLPPTIAELNVSFSKITNIDGLAKYGKLEELDVRDILVTNMKLLPRMLLRLKLSHSGIDNLEGLPEHLTDLEFSGTKVDSLKNIPDSVQRLKIVQNSSLNIDRLPKHLERLEAAYFPEGLELPNSFRTLIFSNPGPGVNGVSFIPGQIKDCEFHNSRFEGDLPKELESLKIYDESSAVPLNKIPEQLQRLKIRWPKDASFSDLPKKRLTALDISESMELRSLAGIPNVSELDISHTGVKNFNDIPESVTTLRFNLCDATSLTKFPSRLEELYLASCAKLDLVENIPGSVTILDLSGTSISSLPGLETKVKLTSLNISGTNIRGHLPKLPQNLQVLILDAGQITTLEGLPKSVKKLVFKGSHG